MNIDEKIVVADVLPGLERLWELSGAKLKRMRSELDPKMGAPVFTIQGRYTSRGWTEWTEGFWYGSEILQFDATGDKDALAFGRERTRTKMAAHVTHAGVHDHGFNNVSTYGNLLRLLREQRLPNANAGDEDFYELALKASDTVQALRWTELPDQEGFIHSFNGAHSLFVDTIRSCRALMLAHSLGHTLLVTRDRPVSLLRRAIAHMRATARYAVFYGTGRDRYDVRGRTAHESIFDVVDGAYRCPNSQQGYSGFTTWTRGLAWAMLGFAEQLEFIATLPNSALEPFGGRARLDDEFIAAARATCDYYISHTPLDGIPYWDNGAPGLSAIAADPFAVPADPYNDHEPIDSSAAAIAAQALLRLARVLRTSDAPAATRYEKAALTVTRTLLHPLYLSEDETHHGLLLHSVYHHPNGWDHVPEGRKVPCGEACMWGDYHLRELALSLHRPQRGLPEYSFFGALPPSS